MDFSSQEEDERGGDYNKGHLSFGKRARGFLQRASSFETQGALVCSGNRSASFWGRSYSAFLRWRLDKDNGNGAQASGGLEITHFFDGGGVTIRRLL